jgi:hypothetical protein
MRVSRVSRVSTVSEHAHVITLPEITEEFLSDDIVTHIL